MATVFVFGSNTQGRHGRGAAKRAVEAYGAIYGQSEGRQGNSYAIITKELRCGYGPVPLSLIHYGVLKFLRYARAHPDDHFLVTRIGSGLAGFDWERVIRPMFGNSVEPTTKRGIPRRGKESVTDDNDNRPVR